MPRKRSGGKRDDLRNAGRIGCGNRDHASNARRKNGRKRDTHAHCGPTPDEWASLRVTTVPHGIAKWQMGTRRSHPVTARNYFERSAREAFTGNRCRHDCLNAAFNLKSSREMSEEKYLPRSNGHALRRLIRAGPCILQNDPRAIRRGCGPLYFQTNTPFGILGGRRMTHDPRYEA